MSLRLIADCVVWVGSGAVGAAALGASLVHGVLAGGVAAVVQLMFGGFAGLYRGRWRAASFDEAVAMSGVVTAVTIVLLAARVAAGAMGLTIAVSLLTPALAFTLMLATRGLRRRMTEVGRRKSVAAEEKEPVLIVGAGDGGAQLIRAMFGNPRSRYEPVAIVDDDPAKRNLRIQGVPVCGTSGQLVDVAAQRGIRVVVVAIPSAGARVIRQVANDAADAGLDVRVLPPTQEIVDGIVSARRSS